MRNCISKKLCLLVGFLWVVMITPLAFAQSTDADVQEPSSVDTENAVAAEEAAEQEQAATEAAPEIAQVEDEEEQSRFIPTEQLSQDLGASFPVDI